MPTGNLGSLVVGLVLNTDKFSKNAQKARLETRMMNAATSALRKTFLQLGAAMAVGFSINKLRQTAEEIDRIAKASDKLGVGTEAFLGMSRAADLASVSQATLQRGMSAMERNLNANHKAFKSLNQDVETLRRLNPEFVFFNIADAIKSIPDPGARLQAARDIFGKGGEEMMPMLLGGSAELRRQMAMHSGFSRGEAGGVESANDAMTRVTHTFSDLGMTMAVKFGPAVESAADALNSAFGGANFSRVTKWTGELDKMSDSQFAKFRTQWNLAGGGLMEEGARTRRLWGTSAMVGGAKSRQMMNERADVDAAIRERELRMLQRHQESVAGLGRGGPAGGFPMLGIAMHSMNRMIEGAMRAGGDYQGMSQAQIHRIETALQESALLASPREFSSPSFNAPNGLSALEKGSAAAFSQERRSQQHSQQLLDVNKQQLKQQEQATKALKSIDSNLRNASFATESANLA